MSKNRWGEFWTTDTSDKKPEEFDYADGVGQAF